MKHRILTLVLALAVLLGLVCATGITASAEESTQPVTEYGVWVAGVQFTSENTVIDVSDFSGKSGITVSGKATYTHSDNTVEFENFKVNSQILATVDQIESSAMDKNYNAVLYSSKSVKIKLSGENSITNAFNPTAYAWTFQGGQLPPANIKYYGVYVAGALTFSGTGSLNVNFDIDPNTSSAAIVAESLVVDCANLAVSSAPNTSGFNYGAVLYGTTGTVLSITSDGVVDVKGVTAAFSTAIDNTGFYNNLPQDLLDSKHVKASTEYDGTPSIDYINEEDANKGTYKHINISHAVFVDIYVPEFKNTNGTITKEYKVWKTIKLVPGSIFSEPVHPTLDKYLFMGWYDAEYVEGGTTNTPFVFGGAVNKDMKLYARYVAYDDHTKEIDDKIEEINDKIGKLNEANITTDLATAIKDLIDDLEELNDAYGIDKEIWDKYGPKITALEKTVNETIEKRLKNLESYVVDLKTDLYKALDKIELNKDKIINLTKELTELEKAVKDINTALEGYATDAELKAAIDGVNLSLDTLRTETQDKISDLNGRVTELESDLDDALTKISTNDGHISALKAEIQQLIVDREKLWAEIKALNEALDGYVTTTDFVGLKQAVADLNSTVATADKNLQDQIDTLREKITALSVDLEKKIEDKADAATVVALTNQLAELNTTVGSLKSDLATTNTNLGELETSLKKADEAIWKAIEALQQEVDSLKSQLSEANGRIDKNEKEIAELTAELDALVATIDALNEDFLEAKAELDALKAEIENAKQEINTAIDILKACADSLTQDLESALGNIDIDAQAVAAKVSKLYDAVKALTYVATTKAAGELKAELDKYISAGNAAIEEAINDLKNDLNESVSDLMDLINSKAETSELAAAVKEITDKIAALESLINDADDKLKEELKDAIDAAVQSVAAAFRADLEKAVEELKALIDAQINPEELAAAIKNVTDKINTLETVLKNADAALREELQSAIEDAKTELNELIKDLTERVTKLEENLKAVLEDVASNAGKIATLTSELATLSGTVEKLVADLKAANLDITGLKEAVAVLESARTTMQAAIDGLTARVKVLEDKITTALADISANAKEIADLTAQLGTLTNTVNGLVNDLSGLNITVANLDKAVAALQSAQTTMQAAIDDLTARVKVLEDKITTALADISANAKEIADLTAQLGTLTNIVNGLVNDLSGLNITVANLDKAVAALQSAQTTMQAAITDLTNRVVVLEDKLTTALKNVSDNAEEIAKLAGDLVDLKGTVGNLVAGLEAANIDLGALKDAVAALQSAEATIALAIATLTSRLDVVEKQIKDLLDSADTDIEELKAKLEELRKIVDELEALKDKYFYDYEDIKSKIENEIGTTREDLVNYIKEKIKDFKDEIRGEAESLINAKLAEYEGKIAGFELALAELGVRDEQLQEQINELNAEIEKINNRLDALENEANSTIETLATALLATGTILSLGAIYFIFGNRFFPVDTRRSYQHVYIKDGVSKVRHTKSQHKK